MGPEPLAGLVQELANDRPGVVRVAAVRRQDVAVADTFLGRNDVRDFVAAQQVPEAVAHDAAPNAVENLFFGSAKFGRGVDSGGMQPGFHGFGDAGEVPEFQFV